jgi:hypothetical protein
MQGDAYVRDIFGLANLQGRTNDIRPIMGLARNFMAEARAAGATTLRINGHVVVNENVLRIQRLARALGGTAYSDPSGRTITIEIPLR